jgi:hypothetical protein
MVKIVWNHHLQKFDKVRMISLGFLTLIKNCHPEEDGDKSRLINFSIKTTQTFKARQLITLKQLRRNDYE